MAISIACAYSLYKIVILFPIQISIIGHSISDFPHHGIGKANEDQRNAITEINIKSTLVHKANQIKDKQMIT
jgi:hypothetical protein